ARHVLRRRRTGVLDRVAGNASSRQGPPETPPRVAERRRVRARASRPLSGERPEARNRRDVLGGSHDEAADLPRVGRLLRDDGRRNHGPPAPRPRLAPDRGRVVEPRRAKVDSAFGGVLMIIRLGVALAVLTTLTAGAQTPSPAKVKAID